MRNHAALALTAHRDCIITTPFGLSADHTGRTGRKGLFHLYIGNLCAAEKASLCEGYVTVCILTLRDAPPQPLQNKGFAIYVTV